MEELGTLELLWKWLRGGGWKWLAGATMALTAAYLVWSFYDTRRDLADARTTIAARDGEIALLRLARQADDDAIKTRTIYVDRVVKEATKQREKSNEALKANPDWANEPVPAAVADSLRP